jgi:predicted ferric reductase
VAPAALALVAVTVVAWSLTAPSEPIAWRPRVSQLFGALALLRFAGACFTATRHPILDRLCDGGDKAYLVHKWLGIVAVALVFAHVGSIGGGERPPVDGAAPTATEIGALLGRPSAVFFLILGLFAVVARKTGYETWKSAHKWMALPYAVGLAHYYLASDFAVFAPTAFSVWMNAVNLSGAAFCVYTVFFYEKVAYPHRFAVSQVRAVADDVVEITGRGTGRPRRRFAWAAGQFAFVKFADRRLRFPSHPFTISGAFTPQEIQFTVKSLGDHTARLVDHVRVGDAFAVTRPHGTLQLAKGGPRQVWIAGGIGITPFRSLWRSGVPNGYRVDLFYAYNSESEAPYLDELSSRPASERLRIHLIDHSTEGFLTARRIEAAVAPNEPVDVFFCGPEAMRAHLRRQLKGSHVRVRRWHHERFQFR